MAPDRLWTALINVRPAEGVSFEELVESIEGDTEGKYLGAWAKVLVKEASLLTAYETILAGADEKQFVVIDFEYLDDFEHYKNSFDIGEEYNEAESLLRNSDYRFCIVGRLYPYTEDV